MTIDIKKIKGPIICKIGEQTITFSNGEELEKNSAGFVVDSVEVEKIVINLAKPAEDWIAEHIEMYGSEPNLFDGV